MVKQANFTVYLYRWVNVTGYVEMVTAIKSISNSHIAGAEAHVNVSDSDRQQELNPVNMAQTRGRGGPMDKVILPQTTSRISVCSAQLPGGASLPGKAFLAGENLYAMLAVAKTAPL